MSTVNKIESILNDIDNKVSSSLSTSTSSSSSPPQSVRAYDYRNQLIVSSQFVLSRLGTAPIGIVLGSGLGGFGDKLKDVKELPYSEIPFLPQPTVKGHSGRIIMGYLGDKENKKRIMCFSGRLHSYEGYPMYQVTFCARLAYLCGVHTLILTNAAGGCIPNQRAGSVVIMTDYIRDVNYHVLNHSANDQMFGVRHMKCNNLLDKNITNLLLSTAKETKFPYYSGTYWWCLGPCYETSSQIRFSIKTGAQCVGMSTVPSILAANNIGLRVAAMSLCTNVAAGLADEELNHDIVVENAKLAAHGFTNFVEQALLKIDNPDSYNSFQFESNNLHDLKLNLSKLSMDIDTATFDEYIYPRKYIGTYNEIYKDIAYLRNFLSNILDLKININDSNNISSLPQKTQKTPKTPPQIQKTQKIDFAPHQYHTIKGNDIIINRDKIQNRDGPIPIWILHDPFQFDTATLQCPIAVPLKTLSGWKAITTSFSAQNAILNFGFDQYYNLIVVIIGLSLSGFSFDESNYIINLLYGVLGHKNLYFTNMFYAFPTKTMYSDDDGEEEKKNDIPRGQYALIKDSVDFKGGFPRFPRPLFPPKEINTNDCYIRMKYGIFGNKKSSDSQVECLKGFKGFFDNLNESKKTNIYSYAYWPGPNFPTCAELNISDIAGCELSGISNPFMTPMSRQLGHDGYSVAYVAKQNEFDAISLSKGKCINKSFNKNVTSTIFSISSSIIKFFKSSACLFSPASMNRNRPSIFHASTINDKRLFNELSSCNIPYKAPQYQVLHKVEDEWEFINEAAEFLQNVWNFNDHSISNVLFSSFSHVIDPLFYDNTDIKEKKQHQHHHHEKRHLVSVNLANIPGWKEHFCGGYPYSHYHWNNDNPFEWTLKIFRYDNDYALSNNNNNYYIVIAPHFFTNTKLHPQRYAYMTSFYKYTPRFWNLSFIVRVLWKLGVKNVCFLSHLIGNNCDGNKEFKTLNKNSVVTVTNYIECARWCILTGPNDERMGPRFTPITEPVELEQDFIKIVQSKKFNKKIPSVITVHVPSTATISSTTSSFYGNLGYQTRVLGLVPCIQTAQHLGLKKLCIGITDYTIDEKLQNVKSFHEIIKMIECMFGKLEPKQESQTIL